MAMNQRGHENNPFVANSTPESPRSRTGEETEPSRRSVRSPEHDFCNVGHYMPSVSQSQSSTTGRGKKNGQPKNARSERSPDTSATNSGRKLKRSTTPSKKITPHLLSNLNLPSTESINNDKHESAASHPGTPARKTLRKIREGTAVEKPMSLQDTQMPDGKSELDESSANINLDQASNDGGFFGLLFSRRLRSARPEFFLYWLMLTVAYVLCVILLIVAVIITYSL